MTKYVYTTPFVTLSDRLYTQVGNIILLFGQLFQNFALLCFQFLGKLLGFPVADANDSKKKRSLSETGWIPTQSANVTASWGSTCRDFVAAMNNTANPTDVNKTDVDICLNTYYWTSLPVTFKSSPCDQRFAEFYPKNVLWSRLPLADDRETLYQCQVRRTRLLQVRETFDFVPPDLMDDVRVTLYVLNYH